MSIGIPPPPDAPDDQVAAWYFGAVQQADAEGDDKAIQDLISGAIDAGVVGHLISVAGSPNPVRLHTLLAPYRRDLAAEDEERSAFLADTHDLAVARRRAERRQSW